MSWHTYGSQNNEMVDKFTRLAIITSKEVENSFRCVSRAAFVSKDLLDEAFIDAPIRGSPHIHMSAPHMYATILEDLDLEAGMSFLNVGSGTGYFSCLAGYILKPQGINHGIELHEDLVEYARVRTADFLLNGPSDTKEICPPLYISGNCFQLDPSQLKYDRLYCGGACSQSTITFFLEFLKVGGFLIAPVGTKLVKLERVSHKEGVKTVISEVCFAPLTRLNPNDLVKLKHGLLPLVRFPIKTKKQKTKKTIFAATNFPVSSSPARKKIARLRALQHILDCLEEDFSIPLPLCYVPLMEQMNAYKQYKKVIDCQLPKSHLKTSSSGMMSGNVNTQTADGEERSATTVTQASQGTPSPLMTIQEFLLAASPPTVYDEFFATSTRSESAVHTDTREMETFLGPRFSSRIGSRDSRESLINVIAQNRQSASTEAQIRKVTVMDKTKSVDFDIGDKISQDIWEHLCTDKLWETVVDYYYSVCSTGPERKKKCFELKGVEIVNPAAAKLADVLLFKMQKKKAKSRQSIRDTNTKKETSNSDVSSLSVSSSEVLDEKPPVSCSENCIEENLTSDVHAVVKTLVDHVSQNHNEAELNRSSELNMSSDSLDSVLTIPSLNYTDEGCSSSLDNIETDNTLCSTPQKRSTKRSKYVDIKTDKVTTERLSHINQTGWTIDHDVQLVSFLVCQGKETEVFTLRDNVPKLINKELFDKMKLIKYPLLSSIQPATLTYRSIALIRVAKLLDSVLDIVVGPSLDRKQFNSPFGEKGTSQDVDVKNQSTYPLKSFTATSFKCSDCQLNVLEAQNTYITKSHVDDDNDDGRIENDKDIYQAAKSEQDEELLKEVNSMISYEMSNVTQQQVILQRKLHLVDNIDEQYKEQVRLLTQQIDLIEEQQRLLFEANVDVSNNPLLATQLTNSQQIVADRKVQRQTLIAKRDKISNDRVLQMAERKELLSMLEQLLSLETRLKSELNQLEKKGMGYLREQGSGLSNFSQFVRKAQTILTRLKTSNTKMNEIAEEKKLVKENKTNKEKKKLNLRYQPELILPRCRFLLPLSKKRHSFVKEMLRTTERSAPNHITVVNVDRRIPISERYKSGLETTVFMQIFQTLKQKDLHYRWNKKSYDQWWEVKFSGEGIIDQGGGFRDSLTEISEELCPAEKHVEIALPLFIKTANQKSGFGEYLDCFTLNPSCDKYHLYRWLGQLFGACFRTDESIPLPLPPFIWKLLVGEHVSWKRDFAQIDEAAVRNVDGLENLDEDAYIGLNIEETYTITLTDGTTIELLDNGASKIVKCSERANYSHLVREKRMMECVKQVKALRDGLITVIPEAVLSCLTWENLEKGICGDPCISVADLKANCRYADDLKATSQCVLHMWTAIASFTDDERSRFIRFITGRKRLPSPFIVSRSSSDKDDLPSASTCGCNLFLPDYSSIQVAKEKIRYGMHYALCGVSTGKECYLKTLTSKFRYAIYNCIAIDTDTSPW